MIISSHYTNNIREVERKVIVDHHPLQACSDVSDVGLQFVAKESNELSPPRVGSPVDTVIPWDTFNTWLYCVCVVTFDIELGQAIEKIYPPHVKLTEKEVGLLTLTT